MEGGFRMAQYRFPLQKLLDIRIDKEEQSKRKFMEAQRQKLAVEQKLNSLKESYNKYNVVDFSKSIVEQKIKNNYLNALNIGISQTGEELIKKNENLEIHRIDLKQKQIEKKTVEILKEKKTNAFIKEEERKEQITNDEFALYSFIRKLERR